MRIRGETKGTRERVVGDSGDILEIEARRASPARELGRTNELQIVVGPARQHAGDVFRADDRHGERPRMAIQGRYDDLASRPNQGRERGEHGRGIGNVLEELHARDRIEVRGMLARQSLRRHGPSRSQLDPRLERVQARDVETGLREIDAEHVRAGRGPWPRTESRRRSRRRRRVFRRARRRDRCTAGAADSDRATAWRALGGSHQRCAMASNLATSAASTLEEEGELMSAPSSRVPRSAFKRAASSGQSRRVNCPSLSSCRPATQTSLTRSRPPASSTCESGSSAGCMAGPPRSRQHRSAHLPASRVPISASSPRTAAPPRAAVSSTSRAREHRVLGGDAAVQREQLDVVPQILRGAARCPSRGARPRCARRRAPRWAASPRRGQDRRRGTAQCRPRRVG